MKTKELETKIKELKGGMTLKELKIKSPKTFYKVQRLSDDLSEMRSFEKGQFITKEHLTEYKGLIIWLIKNKCNYQGMIDLKRVMTEILLEIENKKKVYITEKGIKGIISRITISKSIDVMYDQILDRYGIDLSRQNTMNCRILSDFQSWKLNVLMN